MFFIVNQIKNLIYDILNLFNKYFEPRELHFK